MRIIGGHDYYDSGLAYGQDASLTFVRGESRASHQRMRDEFHLPRAILTASFAEEARSFMGNRDEDEWNLLRAAQRRIDGRVVRHETTYAEVVLCGTLRRGVRIESNEMYGTPTPPADVRWMWSADAVRAYALDHGLTLREGKTGVARKWIRRGDATSQIDVPELTLDEWFQPVRLEGAALDALVRERVTLAWRTPVGYPPRDESGRPLAWAIDQAGLRDMEFAKAVDPYTAFQEIAMWRGGVLPAEGASTVEIVDDRVKIAKHGFDGVTSFRRGKTA